MNIKQIIREEIDGFEWLEDAPQPRPWEVKVSKKIIDAFAGTEFKIELNRVAGRRSILINDNYGNNYSVLYLNETIIDWANRIKLDLHQSIVICGEDCDTTQKYKEIYNIFVDSFFPKPKSIRESEDDFEWMRGDIYFPIDFILGKEMRYRQNDSNYFLSLYDTDIHGLHRGDLTLGVIGKSRWWATKILQNGHVVLTLEHGDTVDYSIKDVEKYVDLGIWSLFDENGNILNDFPTRKSIEESVQHLNKIVKKLSLLTEDGKTEPDMVWDFTKKELDKSKRWVKTKEDVNNYLNLLLSKIKNLPKNIRLKILKYVLFSFFSIIGIKELSNLTQKLPSEDIQFVMKQIKTPKIDDLEVKEIPNTKKEIRDYSDSLINLIKEEEGLRLTAYKLGDGMVTIGYGHAEKISQTDLVPGETTITKTEAEKLLKKDLEGSRNALNRILDSWGENGIDVELTQGMYDAMVSMIYNMGIGNFRKSNFLRLVKKGKLEEASEEIKNMSANLFKKYPGLKVRREKESELFNS